MKRSRKEQLALGLGLLAGGALGYWLNSDKGRKVRHDAAEKTTEYSEKAKKQAEELSSKFNKQASELSEKLNKQAEELKGGLNATLEQTQNYINQASESVRERLRKGEGKVEEVGNDFQAGVNYALKNIQNKAKELVEKNGMK